MNVFDLFRLDNRVALITGGSKGLGKAMALGLAQAGADIAICARTDDVLSQSRDEIAQATGRRVVATTADLAARVNPNDWPSGWSKNSGESIS